jgi:hypothetical protein
MEKRDNKERELKESMEQLARNTERYKEELVEGTAHFVVQMNDVYKGIVEDSVAKNTELLAKMREEVAESATRISGDGSAEATTTIAGAPGCISAVVDGGCDLDWCGWSVAFGCGGCGYCLCCYVMGLH